MKKILVSIVIVLSLLISLASCGGTPKTNDEYLKNILKYYRENGMTSWWDILAVYQADENPLDYKGYDTILENFNDSQYAGMASYMIVAAVSVDIGAQVDYYEELENYTPKLISLIEACDGSQPINLYCFAYYALKSNNISFNDVAFSQYLKDSQLADGGFSITDQVGDVDTTAIIIPILRYLKEQGTDSITPVFDNAVKFIENSIATDGTFISYEKTNANSTATALSALLCVYGNNADIVKKAHSGLEEFTIKTGDGFSFEKGKDRNVMATSQSAIALADYKTNSCVLYKLLTLELEIEE